MAKPTNTWLKTTFVLFLLHVACSKSTSESSKKFKFLYYTASDDGSHHLTNTKIAAALVNRGHEVTFLLSNSYTKWRHADGAAMFNFAVHRSQYTPEERLQNLEMLAHLGLTGQLRGIWRTTGYFLRQFLRKGFGGKGVLVNFHTNECDSLLGDTDTIRMLREEQFDMLIGDDLSECQPLLAEMLGLKFILVSGLGIAPMKGTWYGIPSHPAYIPARQSGFTDVMTLAQRTANVFHYVSADALRRLFCYMNMSPLRRKYNISVETSHPAMLARAQLWIFCGGFELEFARPVQPNAVLVASLMLGLPSNEEVPADLMAFIEGAGEEGVVLFTLGGHVHNIAIAQAQMFASGLAKLSQRVIWQLAGNVSLRIRVGDNTKIVDWMPQQKLLDHPKVKALISNGGLNGLHEAAWYGLPVVGIPLFGDQFDNLERAVAKGMALVLEITTLTEDLLREAVTRVVTDPRYRERAQRISRMLRDQPLIPSEKAAFWILHVTQHGGEHLRPRAADLTWIENNLVDVYGFLGAVLLSCVVLVYLMGRWCARRIYRASRRQVDKIKTN